MQKGLVAFDELLVSDDELSESVEPRMGRFHDPASVLWRTPSPSSTVPSWDSCNVALYAGLLARRIAVIPLIRVQESFSAFRRIDDEGIEYGGDLRKIMSVGPGDDQRQRDATSVYQDVPLASLFSPGLSG